jgi:hypothetical protein
MNLSRSSTLPLTQLQILMLKAALLDEPQARAAWQNLRSNIDIQNLEAWGDDLLSLIFHNLSRHHIDDAEMDRLKGVYRHRWVDTQLALSQAADLVTALESAGIQTMLLEGATLTECYYKDRGIRHTGIDILVPVSERDHALTALRALGWKTNQPRIPHVQTAAAIQLQHESGRSAMLHWHVLADSYNPSADDDFWAARIPFSINNVQTLMLNPAHELLRICVHSARYNPAYTIRWVADIYQIIMTAPNVEWERLIEGAKKRRFTLAVNEALQTMSNIFPVPILDDVLRHLDAVPISNAERIDQRRHQTDEVVRGLRFYLQEYDRLCLHSTVPNENLALLDYLTQRLGFSNRPQLAQFFIRKLAARLRHETIFKAR